MKILIICTGNTCRSPMAEGFMKQLISKKGLNGIEVSSAGTAAIVGLPATQNAKQAASEKGVDLSSHRSRQVTGTLVREAELILAMERFHVDYVNELGGWGKTYLISGYPAGGGTDVVDPIGGSLDDYRAVRDRIEDEVRRIIPHLSREVGGERPRSNERES